MDRLKPTNKKPLGKMGKKLEKQFSTNLKGTEYKNLKEMDSLLSEKEQSFKKKFWDLAKMESLVHSDPILSAEYQEMSEDGEEKYGYHYNETIMNMLFNKYVTHDQGYQQKYLNAIPAEKKRRDKSGIHQLQQKGEEKMEKKSSKKNEDVKIHNNSLEGVIEEDMINNNLNTNGSGTFNDREYFNHRIEKNYDTMEEPIKEHHIDNKDDKIKFIMKNHPDGGDVYDTETLLAMSDDEINKMYHQLEKDMGMVETTTSASSGAFSPALGHEAKNNVYEGEEKETKKCDCEGECTCEQIDETTTSASSGAYVGPFRKKKKDHVTNKPAWDGGEMIGENYLTNPLHFKRLYEGFNSPNNDSLVSMSEFDMTDEKQVMKKNLNDIKRQMSVLLNTPTNNEKEKEMALQNLRTTGQNISKQLGVPFEEPKEGGGNLLDKVGRFLGIKEGLYEHHLETREDKIEFILANGKNRFGDVQMLNDQDDETIDRIYKEVERVMGIGGAKLNKPELNSPELNEKSVSKNQQQFMGMVHAYKKGELDNPSDAIKKAADSMSDEDAKDFASTKHDGLPEKVDEDDNHQRRFFSFGEALELAKILDNAPVEEEENILNDFAENRKLSLIELKTQINNHIDQKLRGSESPEYFKLENVITIINDMLDQKTDSKLADMKDSVRQDREDDFADRVPNKKMAAAGDDVWSEFQPFGESEINEINGETVDEIALMLQKLFPNQYDNIEEFKNFAHLTVKTFFNGDYEKALQGIKSRMGKIIQRESMVDGTPNSMIKDNPTSMAQSMKGSGMGNMMMGEAHDDNRNLKGNGRSDDIKVNDNNNLNDFGTSQDGFGGFNDASDGNHPNYKQPDKFGAPRNSDLSKYNKMTEGEKNTPYGNCENCGSPLNEDGHCRRDEVPVAGKIAGEKGSCKKKHKASDKADDNKFNVELRKKREKEMADKRVKSHDDYKKEIDKSKKHMKKLKEMVEGTEPLSEEKRPSALVQMDRLHKDNEKNFDADMKDSNTGEVAKEIAKDELTAQEQIEEVPENPYELAEKIEKEKKKEHEFDSFDNVGNSTNDNNKEIPKRNFTENESEDVMLNRGLGMQDIVYDNKPDERFEKRMEKDMGEDIYKQRQEKMKFRAEAPMYNKDTQPTQDGTEETQFDKNISKFNDPKGIKEGKIVSAKYKDEFGNRKVVSFNINEAEVVEAAEGTKLSFDGMGNSYTQMVTENAEMRNMMDAFDYYMNGGKVVKVATGKQSLTEGVEDKSLLNEEVQKMMKLAGYDPSKHVDTKGIKKNANFKF